MIDRRIQTAYNIYNKYGVQHPLLSSRSLEEEEREKLLSSIGNYQTRIGTATGEVPEPEKKTNIFLKALELWNKPQRALFNALGGAIQGDVDDTFIQNLKKGWTGEEVYKGTDMMEDFFGTADTKGGRFAQGLGGFVAEAVLDPMNLVTLGLGSLGKGFLTGTAKTMTDEAAEQISKGLLRNVVVNSSDDVVKQTAKTMMQGAAEGATEGVLEQIAKELTLKNASDIVTKYGGRLGDADMYKYADDVYNTAMKTIKDSLLTGDKAMAGKGFSIAGKTIGGLSSNRMQDAGAAASDFIKQNTGIFGKGLEAVQNKLNAMFDPNYIKGLTASEQQVMRFFRREALGNKNLADVALKEKTKGFAKTLEGLGVETGRKQDELIMRFIEGLVPESELDTATKAIVDVMKDDLMAWGFKEQDADVLRNIMKGYFPHTPNWKYHESLKGKMQMGGINKKLGITNTSAFHRKYGANIDEANFLMKFRTSSVEAQEEFIDYLVRSSTTESVEAFNKILDKTAEPLSALPKLSALKDAMGTYADLDGIPDFFETSAVKSYITRGLKHNKIIADKEFLDATKAAFGYKVRGTRGVLDARRKGLDVIVDKQHVNMLLASNNEFRTLEKVIRQFEGKAGEVEGNITDLIRTALGDDAGVDEVSSRVVGILKNIADSGTPAFARMSNEDYLLLANVIPIEAYAMPKGVVNAVNDYAQRQINTGFDALGDVLDWVHSKWKPSVTGLRMDYHTRNLFGSSEQNLRNIGFKTLDPEINAYATKIAQGTKDGVVDLAGESLTFKEIRDAMIQTHANATFMRTDPTWLSGELSSELLGKIGKGTGLLGKANKVGRAVGNKIEDQVRTVNFLANVEAALEKGLSKPQAFSYAGDMVAKFHFDYSDLTKFEKNTLKRIMPFYTFAKKNLGLQLELFLDNPTYYNLLPKFNTSMNTAYGIDDSNAPEWFRDAMPVSLPFLQSEGQRAEGKTPYFNINPPSADLYESTEPLARIIGMLSPALKVPVELHTGSRLFNNSPIERYPGEKSEILPGVEMSNKLAHVLTQFGVLRDVSRALTPREEPSSSAVTPINDSSLAAVMNILKAYSPENAEREMLYKYQRQLGNEVQMLKDTGTPVLDVNDIEFIQKNYPEYMDIIARTGVIPPLLKSEYKRNQKRMSGRGAVKPMTIKFK